MMSSKVKWKDWRIRNEKNVDDWWFTGEEKVQGAESQISGPGTKAAEVLKEKWIEVNDDIKIIN